jgi:hypothetical protein
MMLSPTFHIIFESLAAKTAPGSSHLRLLLFCRDFFDEAPKPEYYDRISIHTRFKAAGRPSDRAGRHFVLSS